MDDKKKSNFLLRDDILSRDCKDLISSAINMNGFAPEHNYDYLISCQTDESKGIFADFGDNSGLFILYWDDDIWQVVSEIIAPEEDRAKIFLELARFLFKEKKCKKILVEFAPKLKKELLDKIKIDQDGKLEDPKILIGANIAKYFTPIIPLKDWDENLTGPDVSKLRKAKNRFYRNFKVEIIRDEEVLDASIEELSRLVDSWKKYRKSNDRAYHEPYMNFFQNKFRGSCCNMILRLNGALVGVASALLVPNSDNKTVYFGVNLHDYSVPELGDFLTVLFFEELKKKGYEFIDFGSSDEKLLNYKRKFKPAAYYEIDCFYVRTVNNEVK